MAEGKVDPNDYAFFLRGGVSIDGNAGFEPKPNVDWIKESAWV